MSEIKLEKLKVDLEAFSKESDFDQYCQIFLMRVTKKNRELYKQEADKTTKEILLSSILDSISKTNFQNRTIVDYDPVVTTKNSHAKVLVSDYSNIGKILECFDDETKQLLSTSGLSSSKFNHYMLIIKSDSLNLKFIGNFTNILELNKKLLIGNFSNNKIKFRQSNEIFGFSKKIDLIIFQNEEILINSADSKFESIFAMNELFSSKASEILANNDKIKSVISEESLDNLKKKVANGKRLATRLIKITSDETRLDQTIENLHKIQTIIENKEHKFYSKVKDLTYSEGKISVPEGGEEQLINALSDAYGTAYISEMETIEESRM